MTTWFVTRHVGARDWAARRQLPVDRLITHLDPAKITAGDLVIGSLPVNLVAEVCLRGGRYLHLSLKVPEALRGKELSADDLDHLGATLQEYRVDAVANPDEDPCKARENQPHWTE